MKILVLHGPNLNLFGRRETQIYGTTSFAEINQAIEELAVELGAEVEIFQSNHEGALVDKLHQRIDEVQGCVLNPGGLTQHGVSLHDAIKAMPFPVIEVHLSNLHQREPWRAHSIITPAARGAILGLGWRGYLYALRAIIDLASAGAAAPLDDRGAR
ncbi:MAG: type II 3-dehydroquinate dehydratase [Chloroflexota bacterium]